MDVRKGHGTENDFVVVHDEHNMLMLSDPLVIALCAVAFALERVRID